MSEKSNNNCKYHVARSADEVKHMDTEKLRSSFLVEKVFVADVVTAAYSMQDRYIVLGAKPVKEALELPTYHDFTKANYFLERRELGIINVGGKGKVTVDGEVFTLENKVNDQTQRL